MPEYVIQYAHGFCVRVTCLSECLASSQAVPASMPQCPCCGQRSCTEAACWNKQQSNQTAQAAASRRLQLSKVQRSALWAPWSSQTDSLLLFPVVWPRPYSDHHGTRNTLPTPLSHNWRHSTPPPPPHTHTPRYRMAHEASCQRHSLTTDVIAPSPTRPDIAWHMKHPANATISQLTS